MNSKKRKERKQMITVAIAAAVLLLLIVVYFAVTNAVNGTGNDTDTESTEPAMDIGTFTVADEDYSDLTALSYTYSGETLSFELSGDKWILSDDPDFPIDEEKLFYMAQSVSDYGGFRRLNYTESSIEDYGFDEPVFDISATYTDEDGTHTNRFRIGDQNALTGYYYFYEDGSDYVYMVNNAIFTYFSYVKADLFVSYDVPDPDVEDITAMTLTKGETVVELEIPESAATENEDGTITYSAVEQVMATLFYDLHLEYRYSVDYSVTDEEKASYGLETPSLSVKLDYIRYQDVTTEEGTSSAQISYDDTFTVHFGDKFTVTGTDEDGNETETEKIYYMTEYSDVVYSVSYASYLEILASAGLE